MKPRLSLLLSVVPVATVLLVSAGCSSLIPPAQSDPTRFYLLSTSAADAGVAPNASAPAVHLRQVELASYIRARPMIVRRGDNEIEFREFARWGEPLEQGIGRVLREELLARGAAATVLAPGLRATTVTYGHELKVRVLACEGSANGGVQFRAVWELMGTGAKPVVTAHGDFRPTTLRWDGKSEAALAAQLSQAVSGLAAEIAAALANAAK